MAWLSDLWTTSEIWNVPEGWRQGRGAWGGLVSGQVITSASAGVPEHWRPRAMTISMMAPVPAGPVRCEVSDLRKGSAVWIRQVSLRSQDTLLSTAVVTFATARSATSASTYVNQRPPVDMQTDVAVVPLGGPVAPEFTGQLTFRPALGFPYSGVSERYTAGWIGPPEGREDAMTPAVIAAYADAWWVTALITLGQSDLTDGVPPVATVDFALTFTTDPATDAVVAGDGLWHVGEIVAAQDGYVSEIRRLYAPTGELVALNTQVVAVGRTA